MYLKKEIAFQVFAFHKTPKHKKTLKNIILKLHFPDVWPLTLLEILNTLFEKTDYI